MLTGPTLRTRTLTDACGKPHVVTILRPDDTPANRASLLASEKVWRAQMLTQPVAQLRRARLAVDTAYSAAQALGFRRDAHYILAAQDETGALRGLITFLFWDTRQAWEIALLTVSPTDQGGSSEQCQLRGVGSELTGAAAAVMSTKMCTRTELSPLDEQAREFYIRRGFTCPTPVTDPKTGAVKLDDCVLSCPGLTKLAATYAHSPTDDEDMVVGPGRAGVALTPWQRQWAQGAVSDLRHMQATASSPAERTRVSEELDRWKRVLGTQNPQIVNYEGEVGNLHHITSVEKGLIPTSAVANLPGVKGERPGEHRNRQGADWTAFLNDVRANGIRSPIFITVDYNDQPKISEGNHRRDAAVELGMPTVPVEIRYYGHAEQQGRVTERASRGTSASPQSEMTARALREHLLQAHGGRGTSGAEGRVVRTRADLEEIHDEEHQPTWSGEVSQTHAH